MKRSLLHDKKALNSLLERINSDPKFKPHLRNDEPDWALEVSKFRLSPRIEQELISSLKLLWVLPFADVPVVKEILLFSYCDLPRIQERFRKSKDARGLRTCALFSMLSTMLLQGNSVVPQSTTHLANRLRLVLKNPSAERDWLMPLLELFTDESSMVHTGKNFAQAADLASVIISEHQRREGAAESGWRQNKYALYQQELSDTPGFHQDWAAIKNHFKVEQFRDSRGIIRRSAIPERNWQRPTQPVMDVSKDRFQATFDFFCWKWFLYGMRNDEPLVEKLTVTLTPYGTQIFIPGYWSLDAARDLDWKQIQRLHKARGIPKQGTKLSSNRREMAQQLWKIKQAAASAKSQKLRGAKFYNWIKKQVGLAPQMDDAQLRRMLR